MRLRKARADQRDAEPPRETGDGSKEFIAPRTGSPQKRELDAARREWIEALDTLRTANRHVQQARERLNHAERAYWDDGNVARRDA